LEESGLLATAADFKRAADIIELLLDIIDKFLKGEIDPG